MELLDKIYEAGVVGAGGAGFPTHIKYDTSAKSLLINAAECEPLLHTDQYEMEHFSEEIIKGIMMVKEAIGAEDAVIGIKSKHKSSLKALEEAIENQKAPIKIHEMQSFYPAGDEQGLIYEVYKIALKPGTIPISENIVVSNVTTIKNVYHASLGEPVIRKSVTVNGEIKTPSVLNVPVGTSVKECIELAGGSLLREYAVILGGPMMGKMVLQEDLDHAYISKTTGGIIILPLDHPLITRRLQTLPQIKNQTASACIQCDFCTELCPRYLIGHPLHPHEVMKSFGNNGDLNSEKLMQASLCCECGICELYSCPMGLSPRIVNAEVKKLLRQVNAPKVKYESIGVHPMEAYRRLATDVLVKKISIDQYYQVEDFEYIDYDSPEVVISLSQHIGKPSTAVVSVGDQVHKGQLIGSVDRGDMGACVHASIDGEVVSVTPEAVRIKASERL